MSLYRRQGETFWHSVPVKPDPHNPNLTRDYEALYSAGAAIDDDTKSSVHFTIKFLKDTTLNVNGTDTVYHAGDVAPTYYTQTPATGYCVVDTDKNPRVTVSEGLYGSVAGLPYIVEFIEVKKSGSSYLESIPASVELTVYADPV